MDQNLHNSITKTHKSLIYKAHEIVNELIQEKRLNAATSDSLLLDASQLINLIPLVAQPQWLTSLLDDYATATFLIQYRGNMASEFSTFLLTNIKEIESPILTPDEVNYDFDRAFDDVRESCEIPQSFDNLVEKLEKIIAADLIDSRVIQQALERLTALFKRNKHGSLTSILVSLHYGRFALKAFEGALSANKYLKPMLTAFKEEFATAEAKVKRSEDTLREEAVRRLTNEERLKAYLIQNGSDESAVEGYLTFTEEDKSEDKKQ